MRWFALAAPYCGRHAKRTSGHLWAFHVKQQFGDIQETRAARSRDVNFGPQ